MNWKIEAQKEIIQHRIIKDLTTIMTQLQVMFNQISPNSPKDIKFFKITFPNSTTMITFDNLIQLKENGYEPKQFGMIESGFYLMVLAVKQF